MPTRLFGNYRVARSVALFNRAQLFDHLSICNILAAQVLTAVIKRAQLPGDDIDNRDSFANVKASAAFR